jgi:hypothetical protein
MITAAEGRILDSSDDGGRMLNLSVRAAAGRELLRFIVDDREAVASHYLFRDREEDVLREMRAFYGSVKANH